MGEAKRRGTKEERVAQAVSVKGKVQKMSLPRLRNVSLRGTVLHALAEMFAIGAGTNRRKK